MKSRDEVERQLCRCILSVALGEQDAGRGFYVPADVLSVSRHGIPYLRPISVT
jgi:hypothetical protein